MPAIFLFKWSNLLQLVGPTPYPRYKIFIMISQLIIARVLLKSNKVNYHNIKDFYLDWSIDNC